MATININGQTLEVRFTGLEKALGLVRDHDVPLSSVTEARTVPDGVVATRGLRAPGLGVPGIRKVGTWRSREGKTLVSVRRDQPALSLRLTGGRFAGLLVGVDDPHRYVDQIEAARR
jgi:hypothetical protein